MSHSARSTDPKFDRVFKPVYNLLNGIEHDSKVSLDDIETLLQKQAVMRAQGNVAAAACRLGITRPQTEYQLKCRVILQHGE